MRDITYWFFIVGFAVAGVVGYTPIAQSFINKISSISLMLTGLLIMLLVGYDSFLSHTIAVFGFAEALALMVGLSMLLSPLLIFNNTLVRFLFPWWCLLAAIVLILLYALPSRHPIQLSSLSSEIHFILSMLSYAMFTLWTLLAFINILQSSRLHHPHDVKQLQQLPPLLAIERQSLWLGRLTFILLTMALVTGFIYSEFNYGNVYQFNHKFIFSLMAWIGVTIIVGGQYRRHWRGRWINISVLLCYLFLLLGYIGTRFVIEILLQR